MTDYNYDLNQILKKIKIAVLKWFGNLPIYVKIILIILSIFVIYLWIDFTSIFPYGEQIKYVINKYAFSIEKQYSESKQNISYLNICASAGPNIYTCLSPYNKGILSLIAPIHVEVTNIISFPIKIISFMVDIFYRNNWKPLIPIQTSEFDTVVFLNINDLTKCCIVELLPGLFQPKAEDKYLYKDSILDGWMLFKTPDIEDTIRTDKLRFHFTFSNGKKQTTIVKTPLPEIYSINIYRSIFEVKNKIDLSKRTFDKSINIKIVYDTLYNIKRH